MDEKKRERRIQVLTLAFGIALLPPIWAVLAPYVGVSVGAVALISSGIYVAHGNKRQDALKMCIGFTIGDIWSVIVLWLLSVIKWNPNVALYVVLFVMGFIAVIIAESLPKFIYLPAWLTGWAIGLTIMTPMNINQLGSMPLQIGVAMIVGVLYVGVGVDAFQKMLIKMLNK